jgi:tetratricopeptide (TPR) repeat protein
MDKLQTKEMADLAYGYIDSKLLKDTFDVIDKMLEHLGSGELKNSLEQYRTTYRFMLKYTVEGVIDPERETIYNNLLMGTYRLLDETVQALNTKFSDGFVFSFKRTFKKMAPDAMQVFFSEFMGYYERLELLSLVNDKDAFEREAISQYNKLELWFNQFWLSDFYDRQQVQLVKEYFTASDVTVEHKGLIVSAITLSLMRCFDKSKFDILFDLSENPDAEVSRRAMFGLLIGLYIYDKRLYVFPEIISRLSLLSENSKFVRGVEQIVIQLIRSKETEKISNKMRDEILPEMVKMSPFIHDKLNLENLINETSDEDKNPDWQQIIDDVPGLSNKLQELTEMQMEGADVFLSTFAMLKSFPFFGRFINWLIPFTPDNADLGRYVARESENSFAAVLSKTKFLCNSDKFSFLLSIQQIPSAYKEMMSQSLNAEMNQFDEEAKDSSAVRPDETSEKISNQYVQDLYRLMKLHPRKSDFSDLFGWRLDFHNRGFFGSLVESPEVWRNIGEYYFAKNYFIESIEVFGKIEDKLPGVVEILQKTGYAYQSLGNFEMALKYYLKADLVESDKSWTLKKIAYCYRRLNQPDKALQYYRQIENQLPDDLGIQVAIGHCLLDSKDYDQALKCYFRVEFLDQGNKKVWKPIAWCSFMIGKYDQADKYYEKILDHQPSEHDFMNAGHVKWVNNQRKAALDLYKRGALKSLPDLKRYMRVFDVDKGILIEKGVNPDEIPIMLDRLRYDLGEEDGI